MLTSIALLTLCSLIAGRLFSLLRLPALIGMLLTGILLGPQILDLLDPALLGISQELRQLALVVILLRAGLALKAKELKQVGRPAMLLSFLPALFEIAGVVIIAPLIFGITRLEAAILGSVIAAVSPAVIVPRMINLIERRIGTAKSIPQMIMAGSSIDDIFVIVLFTSFTGMAAGITTDSNPIVEILVSLTTGASVGLLLGWMATKLFKRFHMRDTVKGLILLSISFLLVAAEKSPLISIPFSGLLAVMAMGISIVECYPELARRLSGKFNKLWVAAEIMLFVLVGASINLEYASSAGAAVGIIVVGALLFRFGGVIISLIGTKLNRTERLFSAVAYLPKATVQAAIGSIPLAMGLPCGELVLTAAVLSILITAPLGALGIDLLTPRLDNEHDESTKN
ncbi:MAG: cation:proton antiporter [Bacteroidales bacterium]